MLLERILQTPLLEELTLILLRVADDFGSALDLAAKHLGVLLHRERAACRRLPNVLLVINVFGDAAKFVEYEVRRVKS